MSNINSIAEPMSSKSEVLPVLSLRGVVVFPKMTFQFDVGRKKSILAVKNAMDNDQRIFLSQQKNLRDDDPSIEDIYNFGVVGRIKQVITHPDKTARILVDGLYRATAEFLPPTKDCFSAITTRIDETASGTEEVQTAGIRLAKKLYTEIVNMGERVLPPDIFYEITSCEDAGYLGDFITLHSPFSPVEKQRFLEIVDTTERIKALLQKLTNEKEIAAVESELSELLQENMEKNQREYFLREQMKVILSELGDGDTPQAEADNYRQKIIELKAPEVVSEKLLGECDRLMRMPHGSPESIVITSYLDLCISLPWSKSSRDAFDIQAAQKVLDRDHYGLEKVKERILELLAVRKLAPDINGQILCLVGPPGVGKTSVAKSIAAAIKRKYARIALGGIREEAEIRGHRRTYIGAMHGRIVEALKQAKTNNPVILLDEIDKLASDFRGDPAAALLEALDPEQNSTFYDHYVDAPFDLSKVLFITTANDKGGIPAPLLDRMEIIDLTGYTYDEKVQIAKRHLIPKQRKKHGLSGHQFKISDPALGGMIDGYTREAGVRSLERCIAKACRKTAKKIVAKEEKSVVLSPVMLEEFLGTRKYKREQPEKRNEVGLVNGLAWTAAGGELLPIEVALFPGTGKISLTGSLGEVMQESAKIAISYVRSIASGLDVQPDFYKTNDIHIHAPEGAVPKDGPSAGAAMMVGIVSALTKTPVLHDVAMTGELSLRGRILSIGGLKEKAMAAYVNGIKKVIIPAGNAADIDDTDQVCRDNIEFILARDAETVMSYSLAGDGSSFEKESQLSSQDTASSPVINIVREVPKNVPAVPQ